MKVHELIEWLQKLDQEYEVMVWDNENVEPVEIEAIDTYEATRKYVIV